MDELIEEIRARSESVPVPLELPDMEDIVDAEEQILISMDGAFREFLLTVSDVIYGSLEPVTVADPNSHTYLPEVAAEAWSLGLPRDLIPICEHNGNYYCSNEVGEIVYWQQGTIVDAEPWADIWQWAEQIWMNS